ncbi:MAG: 3-deoxy-8-phosphooctulonate synthase, partial [Chitinophagales bacterium]|nr:3-deoxy-8-phosphooctulonate synthase [Chitinophagales bacterium]MDW8272979.1 3-deoxy-8-phosphooctulonate synthase [Chitinophagales bacterium]
IPAFLCRQTDLLVSAAKTGRIVNIKKGQFLSGAQMYYPLEKVRNLGNNNVLLTERGTMFGYERLVVDYTGVYDMMQMEVPVVMDATHAVQQPGSMKSASGGNRTYVLPLALAAAAIGVRGFFFEIHPEPDKALSDGPNSLPLEEIDNVLLKIKSYLR